MLLAGASRRRIARTLRMAYAGGLLSEDTFVRRLDELMESRLVDPPRLIGDLSFRRSGPSRRSRLASVLTSVARRLRAIRTTPRPTDPDHVLLALDWDGGQSELLLGRHHHCDVVVTDPTVSRRHARLTFRDGNWVVQDLDSTNGTFVNGARVGRYELRPGDRLLLGEEQLRVD